MTSPGISVSPIQLISGASIFCQTFFTDVEVPKQQLVGEINKGWTIAKRLLQHERNMVSVMSGNSALSRASSPKLSKLAKRYLGKDAGQTSEPGLRKRLCQHEIDSRPLS